MKKLLFISLGVLILLNACQGVEKNTFLLNGKTNLSEGKQIFRIQANANNQPSTVDTAIVSKGKFSFKGSVDQIDVNFLFIEGEQVNTPFILEEGVIEVNLLQEKLTEMNLAGTTSNNDLQTYREETKEFANNLNAIVSEIQTANSLGDNLLVQDLQQQYTDLQGDLIEYEKEFIKTNVDSYISVLILERFLNQKTMPRNEVKEIFNTYSNRIRSSKSGINVSNIVNAPVNPTAIGEIAPLFEGPTPTGERIALESFKGKVVIIDFWASWCRPCRIENPNLVRLYKRMHDKGLEIVGVSLDRNKASWERAIADDGLTWNHVSNLQYWADPIAQLYSVRSIPAAFVLNREGRIVAKNLRGAQLDAKIEELLSD
ncbi:MAG: thioredoxin-like domain-containing protein [Flavobacteriaceae bacterium]